MNFYHGCNATSASAIQGIGLPSNVNVSFGNGEMGQGFYIGDNMTLAISWAKGRFKNNPAVLEFDIDNGQYASLSFRRLSAYAVLQTWTQYKLLKKRILFGSDVVFGPFATITFGAQYKFESSVAESLLNNSPLNRIL
ncbi:MAG TPA: hypothetical protein VGN63_19115 [Flavisolibacter sp.]|jgi:hypothetical protein|nr:hypothetical protein [Flavisolibacter sp.]